MKLLRRNTGKGRDNGYVDSTALFPRPISVSDRFGYSDADLFNAAIVAGRIDRSSFFPEYDERIRIQEGSVEELRDYLADRPDMFGRVAHELWKSGRSQDIPDIAERIREDDELRSDAFYDVCAASVWLNDIRFLPYEETIQYAVAALNGIYPDGEEGLVNDLVNKLSQQIVPEC